MSLAAAIAASKTPGGQTCTTRVVRGQLTPSDQADLDTALADESTSTAAIARALTSIGHKISASALQRHRRGDCGCDAR